MWRRYKYLFVVAAMIALPFLATSCYFDKEDTLYGGGVCDTANISYTETIVPILTVYCNQCHSEVNAPVSGDGLILEGYSNIAIYLQQNEQVLVNSVKQNGLSRSMPPTTKIDKCSIAFIEAWVLQGKKNN